MTTVSQIQKKGKSLMLNRTYKQTPDYTAPKYFKIGIKQTNTSENVQVLTNSIPIFDGTVNDDGSNTMTGSSGGTNTTDNTDVFKPGASIFDNTAQNLIANDSNASKIWTLSDVSSEGASFVLNNYIGLWVYILDQDTLDKFLNSGTCLECRFGTDASNYYKMVRTKAQLQTGWNWLTSYPNLLSALDEEGTVSTLNYFQIVITTNNATDEFAAGDVVYDLLRQWDNDDAQKLFEQNYPILDEDTNEVTIRTYLNSLEATGYVTNTNAIFNDDGTQILSDLDTFDEESKGPTDEFIFVRRNRLP